MEMKKPKNYWNPINHSYKDEINDKEAAFKNGKKNIMEELRDKLLDWAKQFETPDFIKMILYFST